jgi:DNA-binding GntR family transcriptional regulator
MLGSIGPTTMDRALVEFLQDSFGSVWSLEVLLALRQDPTRTWTTEELIAELRSSHAVVRQSLDGLFAAGLILIEAGDGIRYGPASADQDRLVATLAEVYRVKPSAVRRLIVQSPLDKLRTFSDAFRIIKE